MVFKASLSIIIPYYYQLEIVDDTIYRLFNQSKKHKVNIEVLIVDSNTNSEKINIDKYVVDNSLLNIKIINTINNLSSKRNYGIKNASADYLIFLDDDVVPGDNFIEYFFNNRFSNRMTSCLIDFELPKNPYLYYRRRKENSVKKKILSKKLIDPIYGTAMAFGVRKNIILEKNLFFNENFKGYGWEDIDYFIHASQSGINLDIAKVLVTHKELSNYKNYFKKQLLMGSWYKYFLDKNPDYAKKIRIHIIYRLLPILKILLPFLKLLIKCFLYLFNLNLPFNFLTYFMFELYFKYANILGMLSEPIYWP